jgi:hypothetical protein
MQHTRTIDVRFVTTPADEYAVRMTFDRVFGTPQREQDSSEVRLRYSRRTKSSSPEFLPSIQQAIESLENPPAIAAISDAHSGGVEFLVKEGASEFRSLRSAALVA